MTQAQVNEAIMFAENDEALATHLDFDFYQTLARKKMSGKYDRKLAIKLLAEYFVPRIMHRYVNEIGSKYLYGMTKAEKEEIADYFLTKLEEEPLILDILPLNYVSPTRKVKLMEIDDLTPYLNRERVKCYEPAKMRATKTSTPARKTARKTTVRKTATKRTISRPKNRR